MSKELSLCADEVRKNEHDQFLCGLFVEEDTRDNFFALQVFLMETARIRDLVNEPQLGLIRLQWWRDFVDNVKNDDGEHVENGTHKEIADTLRKGQFAKELFERYFNARSFDMEDRAHDDLDAFLRYCEATGGIGAQLKEQAIGLDISEAALKIGTAQAIVHILRTLTYQIRQGRNRLPLSLLGKHNLDLNSLLKLESKPALQAVIGELADTAQTLIEDARSFKAPSNPVLLSTVGLEDYLRRLAKVNYNPFDPNIGGGRVSRQFKLAVKAMRGRY